MKSNFSGSKIVAHYCCCTLEIRNSAVILP